MKHLMTLVALLVSTAAVAQIPTLPWNPDGNDDQFIGMPDLLDLLTVYGQEFQNAIVAEDGESAIMYMGDMAYPLCAQACRNLPGIWQLPRLEDLGLAWESVNGAGYNATYRTWIQRASDSYEYNPPVYRSSNNYNGSNISSSVDVVEPDDAFRCYCTAKQLPRVEYSVCASSSSSSNLTNAADIEVCCQQKASEGWLPLGGTAESDYTVSQAFWRFAQ